MRTKELAGEMREAVAGLAPRDAEYLVTLGISPFLIGMWQMIGKVRIHRHGAVYEPDESGDSALITPVLTHYPDTPETPEPWSACRLGNLIDLCAWDPRYPHCWALRTGNGTWLGSIPPQYCRPCPVMIRRSPFNWLRTDCEGLVLLSADRAEAYRILSGCAGGIMAEDRQHAQELRDILERPWPAPPVSVAPSALPMVPDAD